MEKVKYFAQLPFLCYNHPDPTSLLMWWKIYFWLDIALVIVALLSFFGTSQQNIPVHIFLIVTYCLALIGLFSFVFSRKILTSTFWKIYFWFYLLLDVIYLMYVLIPHTPLTHFLSFIAIYEDNSVVGTVIDTALDIPLIYALYRISLGKDYSSDNSKKKKEKKKPFRWSLLQIALWGYSSILTFFLFILAFFPTGKTSGSKEVSDPFYILAMFAPLLIFWLWVVIRYKEYTWNWLRTTLVANALLYSGSIIFGLLIPQSGTQTSPGFDIISVLQLAILLLSFYIFGNEQLIKKSDSTSNRFIT